MKQYLIIFLLLVSNLVFANDGYKFSLEFSEDEVVEILQDNTSKSMDEMKLMLQKSLEQARKVPLDPSLINIRQDFEQVQNLIKHSDKKHCIQKCSSICYEN